ncbi:MAG: hypothetical protein ACM3O6_15115 [Acidobacteriota bacterium]
MIGSARLAELLDSSAGVAGDLRMGEGFNEAAYRRLRDVLESIAKDLEFADAVLKAVVNVLVDLVPAIDATRSIYRGSQDERLNRAIDELGDLARSCAPIAGGVRSGPRPRDTG